MRTLVIIPTYDERDTLPGTLARTRAAVPGADVLVVDDASPDGTGAVADAAASADPAVHVLHRAGKEGLGRAYVAGFGWALARGYDLVVEMDADGSHRPEQLPALLARAAASDAPDLVLGSRWVPGGEVVNWPRRRLLLSRAGNLWVQLALGVPVRDATGGFRVYRATTLRALPLAEIQSQGYCFQVDMTWRVHRAGGRVVEVPISFVERAEGRSKMTRAIVLEALWRTTAWGVAHRARQLRRWLGRVSRRGSARQRPWMAPRSERR
ncbi:polyprenol monophosphomannose synthase [Georgenia sp. TF02-10]|uniref:polyprenol monophosphomannose synthase n=1 Tax=Georgenia sp. TF02-10 TaxID=2917725 RepID=UPI001FA6CE20|nr:polyprenol monophosphomannose synthase [Georgenia sp. TF02-10]UNX53188.1 polyprenol monophosphomannose synthase [Georgenia sp. TF02-10]